MPEAVIAQGHVAAAAARTGALLSRLASLREIHEELQLLRSQTAHLHSELRLPHAGTARNVPWDDLYVTPVLRQQPEEELIVDTAVLAEPGQRHVILGDPGASKSTFAEKLAHDLAAEPHGTVVPLLVVLRQFSSALQAGERTLVQHLAVAGKAPYNVDLTPETVDYLLLNGRAVIILDGLDELTDVALRRRVAELVKGFVLLHPLVPVVATSRRVGYAEASLDPALFFAPARWHPSTRNALPFTHGGGSPWTAAPHRRNGRGSRTRFSAKARRSKNFAAAHCC
nr:hypothetical protein GCM10020092_052730 [Actinoplanes digitatis]